MFRRSAILLTIGLTLLISACPGKQENPTVPTTPGSTTPAAERAPIIDAFDYSPKAAIGKSDLLTFTLVAKDPGGKPLQLNWTSTKGQLTSNSGATVAWKPVKADGSLDAGTATIMVVASNGTQTTTGSVTIQIADDGKATITTPPIIIQQTIVNGVSTPVVVGTASGAGGEVVRTDGAGTKPGGTGTTGGQTGSGSDTGSTANGSDSVSGGLQAIKTSYSGTVVTLAGGSSSGYLDGPAASAGFSRPSGIAIDSKGNIFVADFDNNVIRKINPSLSPLDAKFVTTFAGKQEVSADFNDGVGDAARFKYPGELTIDSSDNIYLVDRSNYSIRKISPNATVTTLAGSPVRQGYTDGPKSKASFYFNNTSGIAVDTAGNVYVCTTYYGSDTRIRRIDPSGNVVTLAGGASVSNSDNTSTLKDGTGPAVAFNKVTDLVMNGNRLQIVDHIGDSSIRDQYNVSITDRVKLRELDLTTGVVTTLSDIQMQYQSTSQDKTMPLVDSDTHIKRLTDGTMLFGSRNYGWLRKLDPTSTTTLTLAGLDSSSGDIDGAAKQARFNGTSGMALDAKGRIIFISGNKIKMYTP
jgi:hypothetical protein